MDAKITIYGFCLALVIAGSFFWRYTMQIDDAEKEMLLARQQMNAADDGVKQAKGWLAARKEAAALIAAAAVIDKDNKALRDEVDTLRQKKSEAIKVFNTSIQRARQETVGMEFPDLLLTSGARFRNVKIQSLDESLAVLQHSEGVSKVPTSAMPPEMLDRLRFGFVPGTPGSAAGASGTSLQSGQKTPSS